MAPALERFDPKNETWEIINIQNIPSLGGCSWTGTDDGRLFIFGGSNGSLLTSDLFEINFKSSTPVVKQYDTDFDF